jgi:hypothetical protein
VTASAPPGPGTKRIADNGSIVLAVVRPDRNVQVVRLLVDSSAARVLWSVTVKTPPPDGTVSTTPGEVVVLSTVPSRATVRWWVAPAFGPPCAPLASLNQDGLTVSTLPSRPASFRHGLGGGNAGPSTGSFQVWAYVWPGRYAVQGPLAAPNWAPQRTPSPVL